MNATQADRMPLHHFLNEYEVALKELQTTEGGDVSERLLDLLLTRDSLHARLSDASEIDSKRVQRIAQLDKELYTAASNSSARREMADWRLAIAPKKEAWWWFLDQDQTHQITQERNWLWNGSALVLFAVALALLADTARRFLGPGPDTASSFGVGLQAIVALVAVGGALSKSGQELLARIFAHWPAYRWAKGRAVIAASFFLLVLVIRSAQPLFAQYFNNSGREKQRAGELLAAEQDFERAIQLNPDFYAAHYNLGLLREDLLDYEAALESYQYALRGGLDTAYNNAARLHILQENPAEAVTLLRDGLQNTVDPLVRATMLKNLGWAWVQLGAHSDAATELRQALAIEPDLTAAHCLLGLSLDGLGKHDEALHSWNRCIQLASNSVPEEIQWRLKAQEQLEQTE